jgi:precorrin-2 dehydrogenase/sirohydrochlorin ferrochelatase
MPAGYPILVHLAGRPVVVVGAGRVATRKVAGLLDAGARVRLVAPRASAQLTALAGAGRLDWERRPYRPGDLHGAFLVIAATDAPAVNRRVAADAHTAGVLADVVDDPGAGGFTTPATLRRGDLVVAVATSGRVPGLAGALRRRLAAQLGPEWGALVELLAEVRGRLPTADDQAGWDRLLAPELLARLRAGDRGRARARLAELLAERAAVESR